MSLVGLAITKHAWRRYLSRRDGSGHCPMAEIAELAKNAKQEDLGYAGTYRLLDNNMATATYFRSGEFRFVVNMAEGVIMTIERAYIGKKNTSKRRAKRVARRKRNRGRWRQ